jgi:hypothetical protein
MSTLTLGTIQSNTTSPPAIQNSAGTEIGTFCRAWVNFNGTGTVAIRASFNVSSITDNGTGDYTVNLATAMPDSNFASVITGIQSTGTGTTAAQYVIGVDANVPLSASSVKMFSKFIRPDNSGYSDFEYINVAIFR